MAESLILGETNIRDYIIPKMNGEIRELEEQVSKLRKRDLAHEREILQGLEKNLLPYKYDQINLSFLGMANKIKVEVPREWKSSVLEEISVPKFSVYQFYGENKFELAISRGSFNVFEKNGQLRVHIGRWKNNPHEYIFKNMTKVFENEGLSFLDLKEKWGGFLLRFGGLKKNVTKYVKRTYGELVLTSQFNGLIPDPTIEKVEKAKEDFGEKICIITETKPEQWNAKYLTKDPLYVGIKHENAYLIDHSDTTPLENIVKDNFLKDRFN